MKPSDENQGAFLFMEVKMNHKSNSIGLLAQIAKGLVAHGITNTTTMLGDRSSYIGMSDIGKSMECMRSAVAGKIYGSNRTTPEDISAWYSQQNHERILSTLQRQHILQRGHWIESGMSQILQANGTKLIRQLEISIIHDEVPITAHLDFTMIWGGDHSSVRILEIKSTEHIPETLYSSYETQLYGQLGLLSGYWDKPCFGMKDENGVQIFTGLTFPEAVNKLYGIVLPAKPERVDIQGWVLCIGMSDVQAFGPYEPDDLMLGLCKKLAGNIWNNMQAIKEGKTSLNDVPYCHGFHPLCDWCEHSYTCLKFKYIDASDTEYDSQLLQLEELKSQKSTLEKAISNQEDRIRRQYHLINPDGLWLDTGEFRFKVTNINGRNTIDKNRLEAELAGILDENSASGLMNRITKTGDPYERLYISRVKK